jgi:CRISPR/Cas system CSM-associated protein Csm2 small subunit
MICNNEMKEKHENFLNVMDEMINKIKKKNKRVNKEISMVDNMMSNI